MTETQHKIDQCVEGLCSQGAVLKAGQVFPGVEGLSREERQQVLEELLSIMAIYNS